MRRTNIIMRKEKMEKTLRIGIDLLKREIRRERDHTLQAEVENLAQKVLAHIAVGDTKRAESALIQTAETEREEDPGREAIRREVIEEGAHRTPLRPVRHRDHRKTKVTN